jgi:hypothetical protein
MPSLLRAFIVIAVGIWMIATAAPQLKQIWQPTPDNGITVDFDGVIVAVEPGSPAARASIVVGDRILPPFPRELFRQPPETISFRFEDRGITRTATLVPHPHALTRPDRLLLLGLFASYVVYLIVGSLVLVLRPNAMTWAFYLYCVLRRYGDLGFYWPGSSEFFWFNVLTLAALSGSVCALVLIFALRFPSNRLEGWRKPLNRIAVFFAAALPAAWLCVLIRVHFLGLPSQSLLRLLILVISVVYLAAAAIFVVTLFRSHGDERQRLRWILVFPAVLIMRVIAINQGSILIPNSLPGWFSEALIVLGVSVPLAVAYAIVRRRVFDVEFAISRALVYGSITSLIAGTFLLLDWFMSKQFAETRFTLTAEIIVALAIGSWLNMLHRNVDRFVDSTFFRQRHLAQERLTKAAAAVLRAESHEVVDRFLVHEPLRALDLTSAAIFRRDGATGHFVREVAAGELGIDTSELTSENPLVLHLLAEGAPVRLADVAWATDAMPTDVGDAVLAMPVLLREQLIAIVLYGPHRNGADIDPDEIKSIVLLVERAGAAYDHIEARILRGQVESLIRERDAQQREIEVLRASTA